MRDISKKQRGKQLEDVQKELKVKLRNCNASETDELIQKLYRIKMELQYLQTKPRCPIVWA